MWFRLWPDGEGLVRKALMPAEGHFMEHRYVDALSRVLDAVTPAWSRLAAGCHLNRRTIAAISAAGFRIEQSHRQALPGGIPLISGVAAVD